MIFHEINAVCVEIKEKPKTSRFLYKNRENRRKHKEIFS